MISFMLNSPLGKDTMMMCKHDAHIHIPYIHITDYPERTVVQLVASLAVNLQQKQDKQEG